MKKTIEFELKSCGEEIEKLAQKSGEFLKTQGCSDDTIQAQIMILRELIMSGKNFGDGRSSEFEMTVHLQMENDSITVEVRKPVGESSFGKLEELDRIIQWISGYQDPFEPYMVKLAQTAGASRVAGTSGLRLARLAYEANAFIDFYVSEDNILNLSAVRNLNAGHINAGSN